MSSMLSSGARRCCGFDIENIMIYPSSTTTSSRTSHSSSPSSTLSNRKPRTRRKRPYQTYNEAAFLLSIACPKVFSTKNITNKNKNVPGKISLIADSPELLLPFPMTENSGFLLRKPMTKKPLLVLDPKPTSSPELEYRNRDSCFRYSNSMEFDTESMLDEEMEHGIDSIMGISHSKTENLFEFDTNNDSCLNSKTCYGFPMGLGFGGNLEFNFGMGMRDGIRALKNGDGGNRWSFPAVNVVNVSPPVAAVAVAPVKKGNSGVGLLLKLNYDDVLNAWSDKRSPLPEEVSGPESAGGDIHNKLAQIDLFSENDGLREANYKDKKCTRLFSKKIRYQVRKINADRRPRSKGRFVRRPNSTTSEDT